MGMSSLVFAFKQLAPRNVPDIFDRIPSVFFIVIWVSVVPHIYSASNQAFRLQVPLNTAAADETRCSLSVLLRQTDLDPRTLSTLWTFSVLRRREKVPAFLRVTEHTLGT